MKIETNQELKNLYKNSNSGFYFLRIIKKGMMWNREGV